MEHLKETRQSQTEIRLGKSAAPSPGAPLAAPGTPLESSTNHGGGKSVFSRARGLSIDLSILTGGNGNNHGKGPEPSKRQSSPSIAMSLSWSNTWWKSVSCGSD
jgi:hypothetical protein